MSNSKRGDNVGRRKKQIKGVRRGWLRMRGEKTRYPEELACMMQMTPERSPLMANISACKLCPHMWVSPPPSANINSAGGF